MSRKLKIFVSLQVFVTAIYLAGLVGFVDETSEAAISFIQWGEFTWKNVGIYVVGNVGEHVSKNIQPNASV